MVARRVVLFSIMLAAVMVGRSDAENPAGKAEYFTDCARCHGVDGRGHVLGMSAVPGYISVDLTQLSNQSNGQFPRQRVYEAIDGRRRPAHFIGDMPAWGLEYSQARQGAVSEEEVKRKISALVDYLESIQENRP
jgi:mono/diheme cytochrome c family protein